MKKKTKDSTPFGTVLNVLNWSKQRYKISDLYPSEKKFFLQKLKYANSFLDIGCATGNFVKIILKKTQIKKFTGLDVSSNMILKAKSLYPNYDFRVYDGRYIKVNDKYDLTYSFGTLHYCNNYKSLISQMIDASKKFTIFDLRFCLEDEIIDIKKSYQEIPNSKKRKLPYNILNLFSFLKFLIQLTKKKFSIKIFGYRKNPAKTVKTINKEAYMLSIIIDKTQNFNININICEKK